MRSVIWKQPKRQVGTSNNNQSYIIVNTDLATLQCRYDVLSAADIMTMLERGEAIDGLAIGSDGRLEETCKIQSSIAVLEVEIGRSEQGRLMACYGDKVVYWVSDEWYENYRKRDVHESSRVIPDIECSIDKIGVEKIRSKLKMAGDVYNVDNFGNILYRNAESLTVPKITRYIPASTFEDSSIKSFKSVYGAVIGQHAFSDSDLEEAVIRSDRICEGAFENCRRLKDVTILDGTKEICSSAFEGCTELNELSIPKGAAYIGKRGNMTIKLRDWVELGVV